LIVDPVKIIVIVNLPPPKSVHQLRETLGRTRYYKKFINGNINAPMENLLKKDINFQWNDECQEILDILKEKMVRTPILRFINWKK
jgi:hypothetical protein